MAPLEVAVIGKMFRCNACGCLGAIQDAFEVEILQNWLMGDRETTDGRKCAFLPIVICRSCLPSGVDAKPLSDVGLRPDRQPITNAFQGLPPGVYIVPGQVE